MLEGNITVVTLVVLGCIILGIIITYMIKRLARKYLICFMGAMVGVLIALAVLTPISVPYWMRYTAYAISATIGFLVFRSAKSFLLKVSTAFIGSFMFIYGVDMMISVHISSNLSYQKGFYMSPKFWGLLVGFIVLTILGSWIQIKFMPEPDLGGDPSDLMNPDYQGDKVFGEESLLKSYAFDE